MLHGTDISAYQPDNVPVGDFVWIKATEGLTYVSSTLHAQVADARRRGMLVGFYHFGHPGNDPNAEAEHFYATISGLLTDADAVSLDHEVSDGTSPAHCSGWAQAFCSRTQTQARRAPVVYTYLAFAEEGRCAGLGRYPLWIADPSRPAGKPRVPAPWTSWLFHQYTGSGIDRDVLNGDRSAWPAASKPNPPEEDTMLSGSISAGKGAKPIIKLKGGAFTTVELAVDNTRANPDLGITRQPPASIRLAMHQPGRNGDAVTLTVGAALNDAHGWADSVKQTLPSGCDYISVERNDDGTAPVGFVVY